MTGTQIMYVLLGAGIRYILVFSNFNILSNRIEVTTPLNSFKRIKEGVHLLKNGIDPYTGDLVHEGPIILLGHSWLLNHLPRIVPYLYILLDILTAALLYKTAKYWLEEKLKYEEEEKSTFAKGTKDLQYQWADMETIPMYTMLAYLFNPFSILNCTSLTTTVFSNFFLALYFYFLARKQLIPCLIVLAMETVRSLYPFILISSVILIFAKNSATKATMIVIQFITLCIVICYINFVLLGGWTFLDGTLGFIFFYRDLQPNIGLFWYFFTEMFEHFRPMFLVTFQMNATVLYLVPLSLKMKKDPIMLGTILVALITIFKSYPCFGDIGFYLPFISIYRRSWKFMAHNFIVFCFFLITVLMMPALWYLWIYAGSANANFYFGVTLAFSTGQIFLVTDLLFAYVKRDFCLKHGEKLFIDGKEAKIVLE